jgi:hypothetical protein
VTLGPKNRTTKASDLCFIANATLHWIGTLNVNKGNFSKSVSLPPGLCHGEWALN